MESKSKKRPHSKNASLSSKKRHQSAMGKRTLDNSQEYGQNYESKKLSHAKSESRIQSTVNYKSGLIYDQNTQKVPMYYSRPGPAQYQNEDSGITMERLSQHATNQPRSISKEGLPEQGTYEQGLPKHRFSEYSKAQFNSEVWKAISQEEKKYFG